MQLWEANTQPMVQVHRKKEANLKPTVLVLVLLVLVVRLVGALQPECHWHSNQYQLELEDLYGVLICSGCLLPQ